MNVALISEDASSLRVHRDGCGDIAKEAARYDVDTLHMDVNTKLDVVEAFWSDFIDEGSMTIERAMSYTRFLPCCDKRLSS